MSNYFVMDCHSPLTADHWMIELGESAPDLRWHEGQRFSPDEDRIGFDPPKAPIDLVTTEDVEPPPKIYPELLWVPIPLMSRRLLAALQACGIDNLQAYETRLIEPRGEKPPPPDYYVAVNIIGLVAAADLQKSKLNPETPDRLISADFRSLAIDQSKTGDLLIFRLAENISAVLAHERVRAEIEKRGINSLTWFEPEEWAG